MHLWLVSFFCIFIFWVCEKLHFLSPLLRQVWLLILSGEIILAVTNYSKHLQYVWLLWQRREFWSFKTWINYLQLRSTKILSYIKCETSSFKRMHIQCICSFLHGYCGHVCPTNFNCLASVKPLEYSCNVLAK